MIKLKSITKKIGSGATPRGGKEVYLPYGIALIRSQNVYNHGFEGSGLAYITQHHADQLSNVEVEEEDVLLNITGDSVARVCQVPTSILPARVNQHVAIIRADQSRLHGRFLRYYLIDPVVQDHLLALASAGATRNALTKAMIENLEIPLPPLPEQRAIGHILGTLDDKIENNRRMNETLEAMAQPLFKSWFVDFDPVRAKMEGRQPGGMDAETAALFPARLVDSELGEIPEGWGVVPLYDCATYINGKAFKGAEFSSDSIGLPIVKIAEIKDGISTQTKYTENSYDEKYLISDGDILFTWSGSPDTSIDTFIWANGDGWLNQHIFRVLTEDEVDRCFVYWLLKFLKPVFIETAKNKQTTGLGHVTAQDLKRLRLAKPPRQILEAFYEMAGPLLDHLLHNALETKAHTTTRDSLLPKLLSGELSVKE